MPLLHTNEFYCDHIGANENDQRDVMSFSVRDRRGEGLVDYLQRFAFPDEESHDMRTYLVRDNRTSELAGYFSLKAGIASINEEKSGECVGFDTVPGIELANFIGRFGAYRGEDYMYLRAAVRGLDPAVH